MGVAGGVEAEASDRSLATEVAGQDWQQMPDRSKRHACDLRGSNGGTVKGYRKAVRFVIRKADGPGRDNSDYRRAVAKILRDC
jgi:hypothetical protein